MHCMLLLCSSTGFAETRHACLKTSYGCLSCSGIYAALPSSALAYTCVLVCVVCVVHRRGDACVRVMYVWMYVWIWTRVWTWIRVTSRVSDTCVCTYHMSCFSSVPSIPSTPQTPSHHIRNTHHTHSSVPSHITHHSMTDDIQVGFTTDQMTKVAEQEAPVTQCE